MYFMIAFEILTSFDTFLLQLAKKLSWNTFETSNKLKKIWFKGLNSHNIKVEELNWIKVSKSD